METRILADLALFGALVMESNQAGFPENPKIGTFIIKDQCLFGYLKIGDLETWYPFASKTNSYIHTQGLASTTWVVNHMLGTNNVWYQVRDNQGQIVSVGKTDIDENKFSLNFTEAIIGTVVVVAPDSINVPVIKASSITIAEGAVELNSSGVYVNGSRVLTNANIADDIAAAVAPKANQATTYTKTETDNRIQAIVGAAPGALDTLEEIAAQLADDQNAVAALTASVISGDASTLVSANAYTDSSIASEVTARTSAIATASSNTLTAAETYTDINISTALVTAASDATTKANNAIAYTDNVLAVETGARVAAISALDSAKLSLSGGTMTGAIGFAAAQTWPTFNQSTTGSAASVSGTITAALESSALATGIADSTVYLRGDRIWAAVPASFPEVADNTTTNSTQYPVFANAASGPLSSAYVSSTKFTFNPSTGDLSATNFNSLSDIRYKENVKSLDFKTFEPLFNSINPVEFTWKDTKRKAFGFIAQEIEEIMPELITTNDQGIKTVGYTQVIPMLVAAIKDLQSQINTLKNSKE